MAIADHQVVDHGVESATEPATGAPGRLHSARPRLVIGLGLSLLSGLLAVWSFEDFGVGGLIWFAFVPAIVAQHRFLPRRVSGLAIGIAVGVMFQGYLGPGLNGADLAWYLYVYGLWIGLIVALIAARSRSFHARTSYRWFVLTSPLAWVAIDFVRTTMTEVFGGTWGMVAYALYERPAILQPVSIFGIHGMNLLVLTANWAIALGVLYALDRRLGAPEDRTPISLGVTRRQVIAVAAAVTVWVVASALMMRSPEASTTVAAIQPGAHEVVGTRGERVLDPEQELARSSALTRAAAVHEPDLVVWREAGLNLDPAGPEGQVLGDLAKEVGAYLAVGWQGPVEGSTLDAETGRYIGGRFNEAAAFDPRGTFLGSYGKSHPGEFAGDFSARQGEYLVYDTPFGTFGSIICFDLDFTDSARKVAKLGANIIAVSSNDVPGIAEKHYTHLVFRAIETRLPMIKADSSYDSAIIDPYGRILASHVSKQGSSAIVTADVPVGTGQSLYVRFGEWFAWLAVALTAAFVVYARFARRRETV